MIQNQISNYTEYDRYPYIFDEVKRITDNQKYILSFGCSTGEEPNVLKDIYFKQSIIHGIDIDKNIIKNNILSNNRKDIFYFSEIDSLYTDYDIIFCMSTLCDWPDNNLDRYTFDMFEKTILELNNLLKINGYIIIYNSTYSFTETSIYDQYVPINIPCFPAEFVLKHDKNKNIYNNDNYICFQKIK